MLPLARDSTPLADPDPRGVREAEARLESATSDIQVGEWTTSRSIYIAYAGPFYAKAAAGIVYWPLRQVTELQVYLDSAEALSYHVLAYREEAAAIIGFFEPGTENTLGRLAEASRLTGTRLLAITPPLPPPLEDRVAYLGAELLQVESLPLVTAYLILAAKLAARLVRAASRIEVRRERIVKEYSDIAQAYADLLTAYREAREKLGTMLPSLDTVASTPTLEPAANILSLAALLAAGRAPPTLTLPDTISLLVHGARPRALAVLATGAEADLLRELRFRLNLQGGGTEAVEVVIGTDPLTAPLYGSLLAASLLTTGRRPS